VPRIAQFVKDFKLHYITLPNTLPKQKKLLPCLNTDTGFLLQTGLAPGYWFISPWTIPTISKWLQSKLGPHAGIQSRCLTKHAVAPHFYGFTWSPVGVATEYLKDTIVLRDYVKTTLPSLSERANILLTVLRMKKTYLWRSSWSTRCFVWKSAALIINATLSRSLCLGWQANKKTGTTSSAIKTLQQKMQEAIP
jgi:hypothetical protein